MIPTTILETVKSARFENHGAALDRGNRSYHLQLDMNRDGRHVVATEFITLADNSELPSWKAKGYNVSRGTTEAERKLHPHWPVREPLAYRDIDLDQVPDSKPEDWETWDEY